MPSKRRNISKPAIIIGTAACSSGVLRRFWKRSAAISRRWRDGIEQIGRLIKQNAARAAIDEEYRRLPSISIDTGVMEKSDKAAMVPVAFKWSDVGSWGSLDEVAAKDKAGNVMGGRVVDIDSQRSVVYGDRRVVATIGLTDMVVVDTPDATLVCPKSRAQDVKKIVDILKQQGAPEHLEHLTVHRPWGSYTVLEEGPGYKVKRVTVHAGGRLSLQLHHKRSEHWVVIAGTARVTRGEEVFELRVGQSTAIPVETKHRLENPGQDTLHIIEVQNGPYLGKTTSCVSKMIMGGRLQDKHRER